MISYYNAKHIFAIVMVMVSNVMLPMKLQETVSVKQQTTTDPSDDFWNSLVEKNIPLQSSEALDHVTLYSVEHARDEKEFCLKGTCNLKRLIQEGFDVNKSIGTDDAHVSINALMRIIEATYVDWNDVLKEHSVEKMAHFYNYVEDYVALLMQVLLDHGADPQRAVDDQQEISTPRLYARAHLGTVQSGTWYGPLLVLLEKGKLKQSPRSAFSPVRGRQNSPSTASTSQNSLSQVSLNQGSMSHGSMDHGSMNHGSLSQVSLASSSSLSSLSLQDAPVEVPLEECKESVSPSERVRSMSMLNVYVGDRSSHCRSRSVPAILYGCGHAS